MKIKITSTQWWKHENTTNMTHWEPEVNQIWWTYSLNISVKSNNNFKVNFYKMLTTICTFITIITETFAIICISQNYALYSDRIHLSFQFSSRYNRSCNNHKIFHHSSRNRSYQGAELFANMWVLSSIVYVCEL